MKLSKFWLLPIGIFSLVVVAMIVRVVWHGAPAQVALVTQSTDQAYIDGLKMGAYEINHQGGIFQGTQLVIVVDGVDDPAEGVMARIEAAGLGEGVLDTSDSESAKMFADILAKTEGAPEASVALAQGYDTAYCMAMAIQEAGDEATPAEIREALMKVSAAPGEIIRPGEWYQAKLKLVTGRDLDYHGAAGRLKLSDNGGAADWQLKDGDVLTMTHTGS
jgi:hypothetical protein